jgi:hypothetical protein
MDASTPKTCPQSVIEAGAAFVLLRHHLEKGDKLYTQLLEKLDGTKPDLKDAGMMQAAYGKALANIHQARAAYGLICDAHYHMACALEKIDVSRPTDEDLVKGVGTLNWR